LGGGASTIEWGDGTKTTREEFSASAMSHTYSVEGTYTVKVRVESTLANPVTSLSIVNAATVGYGLVGMIGLKEVSITGGSLTSSPALPAGLTKLVLNSNLITSIEGVPYTIQTFHATLNPLATFTIPSEAVNVDLTSSLSTAAKVNTALAQLDGNGKLGGTALLAGTNPAATGQGVTDKADLVTKTWTVTTTP